jgi:hypothetical protein
MFMVDGRSYSAQVILGVYGVAVERYQGIERVHTQYGCSIPTISLEASPEKRAA